jgi:DNA-binding transcriptional LysR family regulator
VERVGDYLERWRAGDETQPVPHARAHREPVDLRSQKGDKVELLRFDLDTVRVIAAKLSERQTRASSTVGNTLSVRMDSRRLQYFLAVYEHGSLGRAAAALNLTQPALSKTIHQLERELMVKLFDRTPKGLVPTIYGDRLSLHARAVQSELRRAEREIALMTGAAKGEVRVGATPSIARSVMPQVARILHAERPGIQLTVIEGLVQSHAPGLRCGELDLFLGGWARGIDADLATEVVHSDTVRVCARAGHALAGTRVRLPWLLEYAWAMPPHTEFWRDHLDRTLVSAGLTPPQPAVISNSASFITGMLRAGDFLSYLPALLVRDDVEAGTIVLLDAPELDVTIDISISYRSGAALPSAVGAVIEAIRTVFADPVVN